MFPFLIYPAAVGHRVDFYPTRYYNGRVASVCIYRRLAALDDAATEVSNDVSSNEFKFGVKYPVLSGSPSLFINLVLYNNDANLEFPGNDEDKYQFWINFYNSDGATLTHGQGDTAFDPTSITDINSPGNTNTGEEYRFTFHANNINANIPAAATSWAVHFRTNSDNLGTRSLRTDTVNVISSSVTLVNE